MLALDTATDRASIALAVAGAAARETVIESRRELSRAIERAASELLREAGVRAADLGAVLVADGPGSFTGLRIGVAFAKGVCRVLGIRMLTAPSLLGAARAACPARGTVVAEYDALRGDVYRAVYRFSSGEVGGEEVGVETVEAPRLVRFGAALPAKGPVVLAGADRASAAALLRLIGVSGGASEVRDPASWEPAYGRPAEAETRLLARHGRVPET